jgi:hypothetical protein
MAFEQKFSYFPLNTKAPRSGAARPLHFSVFLLKM